MGTHPDQLITGLFCPTCGYDMTGHERLARVTCPECGGEHLLMQLSIGPPPSALQRELASATRVGTSVAVLAGIAFIGVLALTLLSPMQAKSGPHKPMRTGSMMRGIHQSVMVHESEYGQMLDHVALMIAENYAGPELFLDPALNTNKLMLGNIDLLTFTWSDGSIAELKDTIGAMDVANTIYAFGDFNFVGWETVAYDPRLVFSWSKPRSTGDRLVCFMDNSVRSIPQSEWQGVWDRDATARAALGLPALKRE